MPMNFLIASTQVSDVPRLVSFLLCPLAPLTVSSFFHPEGKFIQHRLYRDSCLPVEGNFLKDLTVLGRDLAQTILVDNSPHAFGYQVENGIPIESWFEDPEDRELIKLERFLRQHCLDVADVRPVLDKKFQCRRLVNEAPPLLFGDE